MRQRGSISLEYALFLGAAVALAAAALPVLFAHLSGYLEGFHD